MAKGRKLTISRSERLLGSYNYGHANGSTPLESPELGEDDIWSMVNDGDNHSATGSSGEWSPRSGADSNGRSVSTRSRGRGPRDGIHTGGLSLAFDDPGSTVSSPRIIHQFRGAHNSVASPRGRQMATSLPVNVPDWSKIYRVDSVESMHDSDDGENESEIIPPHEYVAREYRRLEAKSVFEGVGRTLKGRDLRRVRDAVWSQTGFDG